MIVSRDYAWMALRRRSIVAIATGTFIAPMLPAPALACLPSGVVVPRHRRVTPQQTQRAPAATILVDVSGSMAG
jgi:hypothetical protein